MGADDICMKWRENKCYEFRCNAEKKKWHCGSNGVYRPHINICRHWSPASPTAFSFTISASERLSEAIAAFGRELDGATAQVWTIPALADEDRTIVPHITVFVSQRLVSVSNP